MSTRDRAQIVFSEEMKPQTYITQSRPFSRINRMSQYRGFNTTARVRVKINIQARKYSVSVCVRKVKFGFFILIINTK